MENIPRRVLGERERERERERWRSVVARHPFVYCVRGAGTLSLTLSLSFSLFGLVLVLSADASLLRFQTKSPTTSLLVMRIRCLLALIHHARLLTYATRRGKEDGGKKVVCVCLLAFDGGFRGPWKEEWREKAADAPPKDHRMDRCRVPPRSSRCCRARWQARIRTDDH